MSLQQVLISGKWRAGRATGTFRVDNPRTKEALPDEYPVSSWTDCTEALDSASEAAEQLRALPADQLAAFLDRFAERIEARKDELVELAHAETGLPKSPRLADAELPRTTSQLRQAAAAAREGSWAQATIDSAANIRSCLAPLGPVVVFGPNNFPFAFGSCSGGDFAAAIAAGCPVIAKANSSHPGTTRLFAVEAHAAASEYQLPPATVQLIYRTSHGDGERMVSDPRIGATGYTGSRSAGLRLKAVADEAGKPIYLELSSVNPVILLPGALTERLDALVTEFSGSCLMGTGQFCTNPGLLILMNGPTTETFVEKVAGAFQGAPVGTLLSRGVESSLAESVRKLVSAGAKVIVGNQVGGGAGYSFANTLLRVDGRRFLDRAEEFQTEAFGNASLVVVADHVEQAAAILQRLEGNLTGCIYSDSRGSDDEAYDRLAPLLRQRVGRLLNDKMPTGVAVSAAMNHGGPFPATGHPGFTAVGIPAALRRFAALHCYDGVRPHRLPAALQDKNPNGRMWRWIDGQWSQADIVRS
ncbi:MAG: aldehyde dehydrogenase (NADP(+)) [Pirellulales bacterium]